MANKLELTVDVTNRRFVTSTTDESPFEFAHAYQGDKLPLRVRLVTVKAGGGIEDPFDLVTGDTVEVGIVTASSGTPTVHATSGALSITVSGSDYYADGTLDLDTAAIDGLTYTNGVATHTLEIEWINGTDTMTVLRDDAFKIHEEGL